MATVAKIRLDQVGMLRRLVSLTIYLGEVEIAKLLKAVTLFTLAKLRETGT